MSKPTFNFGNTSAGGSSGMFGQPSNSNQTGSSSNTTGNNPFGGNTSTQQSSIFGGSPHPSSTTNTFSSLAATADSQKPLTFGSDIASTPTSGTSAPAVFGASTGNASGSGLFGGAANTTGPSNPFGSASFTFGKKAEEGKDNSTPATSSFITLDKKETPSQAPSGGLFGGNGTASVPSPFGAVAPSSSAPAGSTTPATSKPGGLFGFANSTTPAGPPPADANAGAKPSLFGSSQPSSGGIFGGVKALDSAAKPATMQSNGLFGGSAGTGGSSSNAFAPKNTAGASGAGLFSGLNTTKSATTGSIGLSTSSSAASNPAFTFTSTATVSSPLTVTQAPNPFGAASASSPALASTVPAPALSLFSSATPTTSSTSAPPQTSSFFANPGKSNATTPSAPTSTPGITMSSTGPNSFGPKTTQAANGTTSATSAAEKEISTATAPAAAGGIGASISTPLAASSVGPAPQISRLKNKTMDEIITRWATDLSTYQKEFQNQAAKVASWDRLLVENGDKIQKLYTSTFEAERASAEVERQLASVESQQDELTAWLDHYEREVDDMFVKQVGYGETLQGPDQERERTYKLAEKLTDRLDEMSRDLTSMIQEINTASATLTKTSKPDDPLSQIVRVLNGHLSQLQWIDQNAAALQAKISAAQKNGQSIGSNGYGSTENDPVDEFYRSYMGRR